MTKKMMKYYVHELYFFDHKLKLPNIMPTKTSFF